MLGPPMRFSTPLCPSAWRPLEHAVADENVGDEVCVARDQVLGEGRERDEPSVGADRRQLAVLVSLDTCGAEADELREPRRRLGGCPGRKDVRACQSSKRCK